MNVWNTTNMTNIAFEILNRNKEFKCKKHLSWNIKRLYIIDTASRDLLHTIVQIVGRNLYIGNKL